MVTPTHPPTAYRPPSSGRTSISTDVAPRAGTAASARARAASSAAVRTRCRARVWIVFPSCVPGGRCWIADGDALDAPAVASDRRRLCGGVYPEAGESPVGHQARDAGTNGLRQSAPTDGRTDTDPRGSDGRPGAAAGRRPAGDGRIGRDRARHLPGPP